MADQARTEEPTARRLREARRKGQVPRSRDLTAAVSLWCVVGAVGVLVVPAVDGLRAAAADTFGAAGRGGTGGVGAEVARYAGVGIRLAVPALLAAVLAALACGIVQAGGVFTFETVRPKLERLDPAGGARRVLGGRGWIEAGKSGLKFAVVAAAAALAGRSALGGIVAAARSGGTALATAVGAALLHLALVGGAVLLAIGVVDVAYQRWRHRRDLRMTREEVRREQREEEGDPKVKAERQRLHRELLAHRMVMDVPRATCVVNNPTHVAVALRYDGEDRDAAPVVLAKGEGELARRIVEAARAAGVPVLRNAPVARSLLACDLGAEIPERLYEAVAEVLRVVLEEERG